MSKLQQNLIRSIEGGKAKGTNPEENAFAEADQAMNAKPLEDMDLEFSDETVHASANPEPVTDPEPQSAPKSESKPEPIPVRKAAPKAKNQNAKGGGGKVMGGAALFLSTVALGGVGYLGYEQMAEQFQTRQAFNEVNAAVTELNLRDDVLASDLADTRGAIESNEDRLVRLAKLQSEIAVLEQQLADTQQNLGATRENIARHQTVLDEHRLDIDNVDKQVKELSARPAQTIVRQVPVQPKAPTSQPGTIEGARVASIDMWGSEPYVVLRDNQGEWVHLRSGDFYKGWRLQGAVGTEAIFKAGSKTRRMSVE